MLSVVYCAKGVQYQDSTINYICGTISEPGDWKKDDHFGDNQELVDNLIAHNIAIDRSYLDKLETRDVLPRMTKDMFSPLSTTYNIPIKAWIYRNNDGTGNINMADLNQIVDELNDIYNNATNIRFYLICEIEEINNSVFTNNGDVYYGTYISNNWQSGALNIHFVINAAWAGKANFPTHTPKYACAVMQGVYGPEIQGRILAHEIGHTLGLYHTHDPGRSNDLKNEDCGNCYQESVSRSKKQGVFCISTVGKRKCEINGDGLCDTDADPALVWPGRSPYSSYVDGNCDYISSRGGTDNWGDTWQPQVNNIMSYAAPDCLDYFSPLQISMMYSKIPGIGIPNTQFNITGPDQVCVNQTGSYIVNTLPGVSTYTWDVTGAANIISGQGTNSITIERTSTGDVTISVKPDCGYFEASFTLLTIGGIFISGPYSVCPNTFNIYYSVEEYSNASYNWSVTNGTVISGQGTNEVMVGFLGGPPITSKLDVSITLSSPCNMVLNGTKTIGRLSQCFSVINEGDTSQLLTRSENVPAVELSYRKGKRPETDMNIYPNAAVSTATIVCPDENVYNLIVINLNGQTVFKKDNIQKQFLLDVREYENGMYFVYLIGEGAYSKKLIVHK